MNSDPQPVSSAVALYLHVPFCRTKCAYCDFTSAPTAELPVPDEGVMWAVRRGLAPDATLADAYCAAVPLFLEEFVSRGVLCDVPSVYVGGGTPTALGERLPELLERVLGQIGLRPGAEVTVEANPDSLTPELVTDLVNAGATRFSLGVQSVDDEVLALLGRCHTAAQARAAAALLAECGAPFSVDLICGVPDPRGPEEAEAAWRASVEWAATCGASHASVYPLMVEDGTALQVRIDAGELPDPDPDVAAAQMALAEEILRDAGGMERYEIASYARPGCRARHNTGYWTGVPYLGVGPSAASMMPVSLALATPMDHYVRTWPQDWRARFVINDSLDSFLGYLWDRQPASLEALTPEEAAREDAMLGMRLTEGISAALAERAGATEALATLAGDGLVEARDDGGWRLTHAGWLLGNEVFGRVWGGE